MTRKLNSPREILIGMPLISVSMSRTEVKSYFVPFNNSHRMEFQDSLGGISSTFNTFRFFALFLAAFLGISSAKAQNPKPLKIIATTGMVGDMVRAIAGDLGVVQVLMGPGVDPHLFKPSSSDVSRLRDADLIFYNGLQLEGKMQDVLQKMNRGKSRAFAISDRIPKDLLIHPPDATGHPDPHIWFDPSIWKFGAQVVTNALITLRPSSQTVIAQKAASWVKQMDTLHDWAQRISNEIPIPQRILVTSHDAYGYFGRAYKFQVVGLQGISTVTEAGLSDVARLVDFIKQHRLKSIFVESSVPHNAIQRIARDSGAKVGGELFSDAMGNPRTFLRGVDVGTFEGMFRYNLLTIVESLKEP